VDDADERGLKPEEFFTEGNQGNQDLGELGKKKSPFPPLPSVQVRFGCSAFSPSTLNPLVGPDL
jgi:hypothetical protein